MSFLSSLNEISASEGLPIVLLGALQAFGALALIIAVLVIMDKIYKKNHPESTCEKEENDEKTKDTGDNE